MLAPFFLCRPFKNVERFESIAKFFLNFLLKLCSKSWNAVGSGKPLGRRRIPASPPLKVTNHIQLASRLGRENLSAFRGTSFVGGQVGGFLGEGERKLQPTLYLGGLFR